MNARMGLGLDAGGTQTRWALARADGSIVGSGSVAGFSALQLKTPDGRARLTDTLAVLAAQVAPLGRPLRIFAGITGLDTHEDALCAEIGRLFDVPAAGVTVASDIEIVCRDLFAAGEGYVVYAGTGSIAAFIDANGDFHRAGGRGVLLDDAGGGFWIAREALRYIWRQEDERPGAWCDSPMAREIFARLGGSEWSQSRRFFYGSERGDVGKLALAVAATADTDPAAHAILLAAGSELARLGQVMLGRFGPRPIALAGRAAQLHPVIEQAMRAALPIETDMQLKPSESHLAAARIAARQALQSEGSP